MGINMTRAANVFNASEMGRPDIERREQRIYNMDIDFEEDLEENVTYIGYISDCFIFTNGNGDKFLKITISIDEFLFCEFVNKCPIRRFSPLKPFLTDLISEMEGRVQPGDLIGIDV